MRKLMQRKKDRGASLIEFAILMPLLVALLLGIVEFGWGLAQQIDVRHKAREALRMAIVDDTETEIVSRICTNSIVRNSEITLIERTGATTEGGDVTVTITANVQQLTGFFGWAWGASPDMTTVVVGRVEQEPEFPGGASWDPGEDLSASC